MILNQLTLEQLKQKPIWLYESEYINSEFVENIYSTDLSEITEETGIQTKPYIVYSIFTDAQGNNYEGYCSPEDPSGLDYIQPVIIFKNRHLSFYPDRPLSTSERKLFLNEFNTSEFNFFPIRCIPQVKVDGIMIYIDIISFETFDTDYWDRMNNANGV